MTEWLRLCAWRAAIFLIGVPVGFLHAQHAPPKNFRTIPTQHYVLSTDVSEDLAREAAVRIDHMFDEYTQRLGSLARPPQEKLLFRLYSKPADYHAAGGPAGTKGAVKFGRSSTGALTAQLMVTVIDDQAGEAENTWHVVQHEGFHLFAKFSIGPQLPVWVSEGLADYYAVGAFVGDGFVTGLIPGHRRELLRRMIKANEHQPLGKFVTLTYPQWMANLSPRNYLQAWSIVHFLTEGEDGKYQKPFSLYVNALARGVEGQLAWKESFGGEMTALENAWKGYWTGPAPDATASRERQISLLTMASFLARSAKAGKKYEQFATFFADARKGAVKLPEDPARWLPPTLLTKAIKGVDPARITLTWNAQLPKLLETQPDGSTITASYTNRRLVATTQAARRAREDHSSTRP